MGDFTPIVVAVVSTIGVVLAAAFGAGAIGRRRNTGPAVAARWREQAELEKARADLLAEQLEEERQARLASIETNKGLLDQLGRTRHDLDDCVRQRDAAFSDIRALERRRSTRPPG